MKYFKKYNKTVVIVVILAAGFFVRLWKLGSNPPGLNQDEASAAYDAWSLLTSGIDRNGFHYPVHLVSWGAGQSVLYSFLSMPFIKAFGLSVFSIRLPNALLSCITLVAFYLAIKKSINPKIAVIGLFLLSINPWHIMGARWGFEANLFPMIFMMGYLFLVYAKNNYLFFYSALCLFALSLYSYTPAFFVIPVFILILYFWLWKTEFIPKKTLVIGGVMFLFISLPYLIFLLVNVFGINPIHTVYFSAPKLINTGRFSDIFLIFQPHFAVNIAKNIYTVFSFLFVSASDGLIWNSIPQYGYGYIFAAPLLILGLVLIGKKIPKYSFWTLWLGCAFFLSFITVFNMNRVSILFLPLIFSVTVACFYLYNKTPLFFVIVILYFVVSFISFSKYYFFQYPSYIGPTFFESFGEAINTASDLTSSTVVVTDKVNMPYIFVLFHQQIPPEAFIKSVIYKDSKAQFRQVSSFGRYQFGINKEKINLKNVYLFKNGDEEYFENGFKITRFKYYSVAVKKI